MSGRWDAAGVRHAVLLRILPVLSHDMATPVMVLRMTTVVLRRKLAAGPLEVDDCTGRIDTLERQADALTCALKQFLDWGVGAGEDAVTRPALVSGCIALLQPLLRMPSIRLDTAPALEGEIDVAAAAAAAQTRWPGASSLRYLLLASVFHLQDTRPDLERIEIEACGDDALRLLAFPPGPSARQPPRDAAGAGDETAACRLDAAALECLARELGRSIDIDGHRVRLGLAKI